MSLGAADLFDSYGRQARLFPGLLTIFCPLILLLAWFPSLLVTSLGAALVTIASTCGLLYALASIARTKGKQVEDRLLKDWGGWPSTHLLRHSSSLEPSTRIRYHRFLGSNVPYLVLPNPDQEKDDQLEADAAYASAVRWLKEHTRGEEFSLLLKENAQYGFRRNLRGLRSAGVWLCSVALVISAALIFLSIPQLPTFSANLLWKVVLESLGDRAFPVFSAMTLNVGAIYIWLNVVTDEWVKRGAYQYAYALLSTCDRSRSSGPAEQ